jgi:hypothetical protein
MKDSLAIGLLAHPSYAGYKRSLGSTSPLYMYQIFNYTLSRRTYTEYTLNVRIERLFVRDTFSFFPASVSYAGVL